jgi:hypothetical protein
LPFPTAGKGKVKGKGKVRGTGKVKGKVGGRGMEMINQMSRLVPAFGRHSACSEGLFAPSAQLFMEF